MKLAEFSIRKPITTFMIYLLAVGAGLFGLIMLKLDLYPDLKFPMVMVYTRYQGVGANDIENIITRPLEKSLASVQNIKKLTSRSMQGVSFITVEFEWGTDLDQAEIDVRKYVELTQNSLPDDADEPLTFLFESSSMPIMLFSISSATKGPAELRTFLTDRIEPYLERIEGVASAETMGGLERSIQIRVDPIKMAQYRMDINEVTASIARENLRLPSGTIDDGIIHYDMRTEGEYSSVEEIANTLVGTLNGKNVYLKDLALVEDSYNDVLGNTRSNYNSGMMIAVSKQSDANTVGVCKKVHQGLEELNRTYQGEIQFGVFFDQSEYINQSIGNLGTTAVQAIFYTFLVLLFFLLHIRSSLIVAVSIPVSMITTFFVMYMADVTMNIISLTGLALGIGMLVDNSIVVLENIYRHRSLGEGQGEASNRGASEVAMPVTASTLTTLAVFVPILFVPGITGVMFRDMVLTICFSLIMSLIVSLSLIPMLTSKYLHDLESVHKGRFAGLASRIDGWTTALVEHYSLFLEKVIRHRKMTIFLMLALFVLTMFLLPFIGKEFSPKQDQSFVAMTITRSVGTDFRQTEKMVLELEDYIKQTIPETQSVMMTYGETGNPFASLQGAGSNTITLRLKLMPMDERKRSQFDIEEQLRRKLETMPDVTYEVRQQGSFSTEVGDVSIKIFGDDFDTLSTLAAQVEQVFKSVEGVRDIKNSFAEPAHELKIKLKRDLIYNYGLSAATVIQTIYRSFQGEIVAQYRESGDDYNVVVRMSPEFRSRKSDLNRLFVKSPRGGYIPLSELAEITQEKAPDQILRDSQERMGRVYCSVYGRDLGSVSSEIKAKLSQVQFPDKYRYTVAGAADDMAESQKYLGLALLIAALLVYMVMASQFESLIDPFIIMFTIPLSFIGVLWALFLTNTTLNVVALIGAIILVGIVVNNGIVLVDAINQLIHVEKMDLFPAVKEAGRRRLRPILMTAATTIISMIPLGLEIGEGAETW
ncbi:MAG: efflux RND transporter permease subunit, partial [Candidatus Delongbacteria bacterium]|nr:efflux RND transporter permease subunit [Candidatus Delongbacteria bacterium]